MSGLQDFELTIDDPVAVLRLNQPDRLNAITYRTLAKIRSAVDQAADGPRVVGIVITGDGRALVQDSISRCGPRPPRGRSRPAAGAPTRTSCRVAARQRPSG